MVTPNEANEPLAIALQMMIADEESEQVQKALEAITEIVKE